MKTSELIGPALDWAVAKCKGREVDYNFWLNATYMPGWFIQIDSNYWKPFESYSPSTDWSQGGPIIERERIELLHYGSMGVNGNPWEAQIGQDTHYIDQGPMDAICGPTPLIAAMRAFVASKLGDTVEIPKGLT